MNFECMNELNGKSVMKEEACELYGMAYQGHMVITGVYASDPEGLQEVRIPQEIGGMKVKTVCGHFCGNEWETFTIGTLYLPDSVEKVRLENMIPERLCLVKTDAPALRLHDGLLLSGDGRTVLGACEAARKRYDVPEGVAVIAENAFRGSRLEEITLPESLREIGKGAFYDSCLRRVRIPAAVEVIGEFAFANSWLQEATLCEGLKVIGSHAFARTDLSCVRIPSTVQRMNCAFEYCDSLVRAEVAEGVREVSEGAFCGSGLQEIILPQSLREIGHSAFECCGDLRHMTLPQGLRSIGHGAMRDCTRLAKPALPPSVEHVAEDAFRNCGSLAGQSDQEAHLFAGDLVLRTPTMDFWGWEDEGGMVITGMTCKKKADLQDVYVPAQVNGLPVTGLFISPDVRAARFLEIGTLHLPDSVRSIHMFFDGRYERLELIPTQQPAIRVAGDCIVSVDGRRALCPVDRRAHVCRVPEGVEVIEQSAFRNCAVREVILPQSLREIGDGAFCYAKLRRVTLPAGLRRIGKEAFSETLLDEAILPDGLEFLGDEAFSGSLIARLHIPDGVKEIGVNVANDCMLLDTVRLPEGMEQLPDDSADLMALYGPGGDFNDMTGYVLLAEGEGYRLYGNVWEDGVTVEAVQKLCSGRLPEVIVPAEVEGKPVTGMSSYAVNGLMIDSLQIHDSVGRIDRTWLNVAQRVEITPSAAPRTRMAGSLRLSADGRELLQQLDLTAAKAIVPEGVEAIAAGAFAHCEAEQIVLPESLTEIGENAFLGCGKLRSLRLPAGVKVLPDNAFAKCDALTEVSLPEGMVKIGDSAFSGCTSLTELRLPEGMVKIGDSAFSGCTSLAELRLPATLTTLGRYALLHTALKSLEIPAALVEMDLTMLCVDELRVEEGNPRFRMADGAILSADGTALLRWVGGAEAILPDGVQRVEHEAFQGISALKRVVVPEGVTTLGCFAFRDCMALEEIVLPASLREIGDGCFFRCQSLARVVLPEGLENIGRACFRGCMELREVTVPQSLRRIGPMAFNACRKLVDLRIPDALHKRTDGSWERLED